MKINTDNDRAEAILMIQTLKREISKSEDEISRLRKRAELQTIAKALSLYDSTTLSKFAYEFETPELPTNPKMANR
jgi:hypothetical protein